MLQLALNLWLALGIVAIALGLGLVVAGALLIRKGVADPGLS